MPQVDSFSLSSLNLDKNVTIMQTDISVRQEKFEKKIDMSKDNKIYSFSAPKYLVTIWFNPSNTSDCPPFVQDRIGWFGEGMTDAHYLDTSGIVPGDTTGTLPRLRLIKKTFTLTKDDLLGTGLKVFH
jgi:hypothetical protein